MFIPNITALLGFGFRNTYFLFQGKYYEYIQGAAMGTSLSPIVIKLFIKDFKIRTISTSSATPDYGEGRWMIPLSSRKFKTETNSWSISILLNPISSSPHRRLDQIDPCPLWTPWSHLNQMEPCLQQCIENQPIQINIYIGTDTTIC